ncbi:MAG TPA: glycosyltransferase family 4 protein [Jatrophihabitantaceae bacterium]|nr:glycosyltransferase family 4 protein [Jatrophihabitantaceae bacterium]
MTQAIPVSGGSHSACQGGGRRLLILNWRDTDHPYGGGSEVYAEHVADGLARIGHDVTLFTARYPGSVARETRPSGVTVVRAGGPLGVYVQAWWQHLCGRLGRPEVIVEAQNGMPFLARLWARRIPVIVLVHHVHRRQWRIVFGPLRARIGWWLESRAAPRINRGAPYVTVSDVSRRELVELGVAEDDIEVIHNGTGEPQPIELPKSEHPSLLVLGRLVPHKRVEIAIDTVAALRQEMPDLRLSIAGRGWWETQLRDYAERIGVSDGVDFAGFVSPEERHALYSRSWVSLVPSVKEGWGLVVVEAGAHGVPSVAFDGAGGVTESIINGRTGLIARADDVSDFIAQTRRLVIDHGLRDRQGAEAAVEAKRYSWDQAVQAFDALVRQVAANVSASRS